MTDLKISPKSKLDQLKDFFENGIPPVTEKKPQGHPKKAAVKKDKPAAPVVSPPKPESKGLATGDQSNGQIQRDQQQKVMSALHWLCSAYPDCFNKQAPKPLKLKIEKEVFAIFPEDLPFARHHVRKAIARYTNHSKYLEALIAASYRIGINGEQAEEILDAHKDFAKQRLEQLAARRAQLKKT